MRAGLRLRVLFCGPAWAFEASQPLSAQCGRNSRPPRIGVIAALFQLPTQSEMPGVSPEPHRGFAARTAHLQFSARSTIARRLSAADLAHLLSRAVSAAGAAWPGRLTQLRHFPRTVCTGVAVCPRERKPKHGRLLRKPGGQQSEQASRGGVVLVEHCPPTFHASSARRESFTAVTCAADEVAMGLTPIITPGGGISRLLRRDLLRQTPVLPETGLRYGHAHHLRNRIRLGLERLRNLGLHGAGGNLDCETGVAASVACWTGLDGAVPSDDQAARGGGSRAAPGSLEVDSLPVGHPSWPRLHASGHFATERPNLRDHNRVGVVPASGSGG